MVAIGLFPYLLGGMVVYSFARQRPPQKCDNRDLALKV